MSQEGDENSYSDESQMDLLVEVKKNVQWMLKTAQVQRIWMTLQ